MEHVPATTCIEKSDDDCLSCWLEAASGGGDRGDRDGESGADSGHRVDVRLAAYGRVYSIDIVNTHR
jgi:hypothetical protein